MAYPTLKEIADEIENEVDNPSWDQKRIIPLINQAYREISSKVRLPNCETSANVTTVVSTGYAALPANFQAGLRKSIKGAFNSTQGYAVEVFSSRAVLEGKYPAALSSPDGPVVGVAAQGSSLYYLYIPTTPEVIKIHYYRITPVMGLVTNTTPADLPEILAKDLLFNRVLMRIYRKIYQDRADVNPNYAMAASEYKEKYKDLKAFCGEDDLGFSSFSA